MNTRGVRRRFVAEMTVSFAPLTLQKSIEFAFRKSKFGAKSPKSRNPAKLCGFSSQAENRAC